MEIKALFVFFLSGFISFTLPQKIATMHSVIENLEKNFGYNSEKIFLLVHVAKQEMHVIKNNNIQKTYRISTATAGTGSKAGSNKTPLGVHRIAQKIGAGAKRGEIFIGRKPTGKIAEIIKEPRDVAEDPVVTRILWLDGLEPGVNKGAGIDSRSRYIYIHGTHEEGLIGKPASHGCIRMLNDDVIELFEMVDEGTLVVIVEILQ